jgi:hypothetical protein
MQPVIKVADGDVAWLGIGFTQVLPELRRLEVEVRHPFEWQTPLDDVAFAFVRVETDLHDNLCMHNISDQQTLDQGQEMSGNPETSVPAGGGASIPQTRYAG